ncbi:MAG: hypothetical protein AB1633_04155 [Elusimicrobiota bacterium]
MAKKVKSNNQPVSSKEFNETKIEFTKKFDDVYRRFDVIDKRFNDVYLQIIKNREEIINLKEIMATKDDIQRLSREILKNNEDIKNLKEIVATKDDIRQIMTAIDSFAHQTIDHERKAIVNTSRIMKLEPQVEDHEKRITALEADYHKNHNTGN